LWFSDGEINVRSSVYPFYGVIVSNQKAELNKDVVWYGCVAGANKVDFKTGVDLLPLGNTQCNCIFK